MFSENSRKKFSLFQRKFVGLKSEKFLIMKLKKLFFVACNLFGVLSFAQVGINTTTPNAALDVTSTDDGLLIPRVALTASNVASPLTLPTISELVYNTATAGISPNNVTPGFTIGMVQNGFGSKLVQVLTIRG